MAVGDVIAGPALNPNISAIFTKAMIGPKNATGTATIELGDNATGDRIAQLDFHADDTNTDYSSRILRNAGVNADMEIGNLGTGNIVVNSQGDGDTKIKCNTRDIVTVLAEGTLRFDTEISDPTCAASKAKLYIKDNGAGKTQLMVKFFNGAAIQLALEP